MAERLPETTRGNDLFRTLAGTLFLAGGLVVLLWFAYQMRRVLLLFIMALIAALVINAPVTALERRGHSRAAATAMVYSGLVVLVALLGWLVVPRLVHEIPQLINQIPTVVQGLSDHAAAVFGTQSQLAQQLSEITRWLLGFTSELWRYAGTVVASVILTIVLTAMTLFLVANPRPLLRGYLRAMPPPLRRRAARAFARGSRMVVGWVTANLILGVVKGTLTFLFLTWLGLPGVAVWTVLAVLSSLLPAVGFYLMAIPPALLAASISPLTTLWVILFFWAMSELIGDFVAPRLWEHTMKLHPVYLLFMVISGAATFGALGVLVAIPTAGFLKAYFDEFYLCRQPEDHDADAQVDAILARRVEDIRD